MIKKVVIAHDNIRAKAFLNEIARRKEEIRKKIEKRLMDRKRTNQA